MAADRVIFIEGLDELRRELRRVKDSELDEEMKRIHLELSREIVSRAEQRVPVRSGRLKGTLRAAGTVRDAIGRVGTSGVPYAAPIHWGWKAHNIEPQPFLTEAAQSIEQTVADRYDRQVADMLDRVIGR